MAQNRLRSLRDVRDGGVMQVWPDAVAGLRAIRRVMKTGGRIALGFTPYSGQPKSGLPAMLTAAAFTEAHVVETASLTRLAAIVCRMMSSCMTGGYDA